MIELSPFFEQNVLKYELPKCMVQRCDLLFDRTIGKELVAKTCVYNGEELMVLTGFVIKVHVNG